jgi:hypothetical protein
MRIVSTLLATATLTLALTGCVYYPAGGGAYYSAPAVVAAPAYYGPSVYVGGGYGGWYGHGWRR